MKKIFVIAHTHWDFEWYFSRQESQIQLIYHMDDVFHALNTNQIDYYVLDGQMAIVDDYLSLCPGKRDELMKYVKVHRLFIGPWYTQVDEMITSGESMIRNLQLGIQGAQALGGVMNVGYLPDSFGQSQDMPKLYNGFNIYHSIFWRGMPKEKDATYFYWDAQDGSQVLTTVLKNGYYAGATWMDTGKLVSSHLPLQLLPVGGDQRNVDFSLQERIDSENKNAQQQLIPSHYEAFFDELEKSDMPFTHYQGEFIDPSNSKIHRGIYDSRADLKQLYDELERMMVYQVEPLLVLAKLTGIPPKLEACKEIWKIIARGQAHDSSGGCNSDKTNQDIYNRGIRAKQLANSLLNILTRKLGEAVPKLDLLIWNTQGVSDCGNKIVTISTRSKTFSLYNEAHEKIHYTLLNQKRENRSYLRACEQERDQDLYYISTIALPVNIDAMDWQGFYLNEKNNSSLPVVEKTGIENDYYYIVMKDNQLHLYNKQTQNWNKQFLSLEDGGDDGDNYDYSAPKEDWILYNDFSNAKIQYYGSDCIQWMVVEGTWSLPKDLNERKQHQASASLKYQLHLMLTDDPFIHLKWTIDNKEISDHRLRMILKTAVSSSFSTQDTPFGMINRPINDIHLHDWRDIHYKEEPTGLRPFIHLTNLHDCQESWTFYGLGEKSCQQINESTLAISLYRGVGYLGKPDLTRRPGDASGLQNHYIETPDSQLHQTLTFEGAISIDRHYQPAVLQQRHQMLQPAIYYQKQTLNDYSTPLQYFQCHPATQSMKHNSFGKILDLSVVISSIVLSKDGKGIILRLYNPSNQPISRAGTLQLYQESQIYQVDFNDSIKKTLASHSKEFALPYFKAGEIQSFAIYTLN